MTASPALLTGTVLTTSDDMLGGALRLTQPARGYRLTSDAVLLAAAAPLKPSLKVLELGLGYGQVSLCLLAREPSLQVTGLELMPPAAALAASNARDNKFIDKLSIIVGSVSRYQPPPVGLVIANPPYRLAHTHTASADPLKAAATVEQAPLAHWAQCSAQALGAGGMALYIFDERRMAELSAVLHTAGLPAQWHLPLLSKPAALPKRGLLLARKQAGGYEKLAPLPLQDAAGQWLAPIARVLQSPLQLDCWPAAAKTFIEST